MRNYVGYMEYLPYQHVLIFYPNIDQDEPLLQDNLLYAHALTYHEYHCGY